MNIAGVIKDWMLIFFSWSVFKAPVTALNLLGYFFCCSGVRLGREDMMEDLNGRSSSPVIFSLPLTPEMSPDPFLGSRL